MAADTKFPKAPDPYDPDETYRFRIKGDGRHVAGVSGPGRLTRSPEVVKRRPGGDPSAPRRGPGQSDYVPITLERGVTHDVAFGMFRSRTLENEGWARDTSVEAPTPSPYTLSIFSVLSTFAAAAPGLLAPVAAF